MSYARIDDLLPHHPKITAAGSAGAEVLGWYVASICHAQRHLTDGVIGYRDLGLLFPGLRPTWRVIRRLESLRLWDRLPEATPSPEVARKRAGSRPGAHRKNTRSTTRWQVHDYLEHNMSARGRQEARAKDALRKRTSVSLQPESSRIPTGVHHGVRADSIRPSSPLLSAKEKKDSPPTSPPVDSVDNSARPADQDGAGSQATSEPGSEWHRGEERHWECPVCRCQWFGREVCPRVKEHGGKMAVRTSEPPGPARVGAEGAAGILAAAGLGGPRPRVEEEGADEVTEVGDSPVAELARRRGGGG